MVTLFKKILIIPSFVLLSMMSFSQITISSANSNNNITGGTTYWYDNNPYGTDYIVEESVTITANGILDIAPGTIIEIKNGLSFIVEGIITANGTSINRILFTAYNSNDGWFGIDIENNTYQNNFDNCIFEYVKKPTGSCTTNFNESGTVYLYNSNNTSFNGCIFRYNETCKGSGITYITSYVHLSSCQFLDNIATNNGGGIYINDIVNSYDGNTSLIEYSDFDVNESQNGGGLYIEECDYNIIINNCHIRNNRAYDGSGCYFTNNSFTDDTRFYENELSDNIATNDGGGLYITYTTFGIIEENQIRQNVSNNGGGVYICESVISKLYKDIIEVNTASNNGGGVYIKESNIFLRSEAIRTNTSNNHGGGVYNEGLPTSGIVTFINCLINSNTSDYNGGGIYSIFDPYQSIQNNFTQFNNTISDNYARYGYGGGVFYENCYSTTTNTIIWGNRAANPSTNEVFPDPDGLFGYSYSCCSKAITNCSTCTSSNPMFIGNGSYMISYGSSCYNIGNNTVQYENSDLEGNNRICHNIIDIGAYEDPFKYRSGNTNCPETWTDHNPNGIDYIITDNITVPQGCTLTIDPGTTIAFYTSKRMTIAAAGTNNNPPGGTINAVGNSSGYITFTATDANSGWLGIDISSNTNSNQFGYCIFEKSIKSTGGSYDFEANGTVFIYNSNNTTFDHCIFRDNSVLYSGGGICFRYSIANVTNCNFLNNIVTYEKGGGIFMKGLYSTPGNNNISNCTFSENSANSGGGAIWLSFPGVVNISNSNFYYNNSDGAGVGSCAFCSGGGAIGVVSDAGGTATVTISGGIISNNTADQNNNPYGNGGGIFAYYNTNSGAGLNLTINAVKIQNNIATNNGGGIYLKNFTNPNSNVFNNNLITNNSSTSNGGGIYMDASSPKIYNCTVSDNTANSGDGVYSINTGTNTSFINDIIYPDEVLIDAYVPDDNNSKFWNCDIIWNSYSGNNNNLQSSPQFVTYGGFDYLPRNTTPVSPCIGAGQAISGFTQPTYDLRGYPYSRTVSQIDMGAFEHPGDQSYKIIKPDSSINELNSDGITVYPNPVEKYFNILIHSEVEGNVSINLINTLGKTVYNSETFQIKGDIFLLVERHQLPAGIYYLKVNTSSIESKVIKILFD
jgi:parallel beta-helix repeat protein/predicted outer membrane repeat protein